MSNKVNSKPPDWDALAKTIYREKSVKGNIAVFFNRLVRIITFRFKRTDKIIDLFHNTIKLAPPVQLNELTGKFFTLFEDAKLNRKQAARVLAIRRDLGISLPVQFDTLAMSRNSFKLKDIEYNQELATFLLYESHTEYVQKLEAEYFVIDVPADGDCFFYSLAHQVYPGMIESGDDGQKAMLRVREELAAYMNLPENKPEFLSLVEDGVDFEAYIASIAMSSSDKENRDGWGGQPELIAASQYYGRPLKMFVAYGHENKPGNLLPKETYGEGLPGEPLHMLFNGVNHWEAMIPLEKIR